MIIVSASLLGAPVRYDGRDKKSGHPLLQRWIEEERVISVCPELLGGLGTPPPPAEMVDESGARRVLTRMGEDVTNAFDAGARLVAEEADGAGVGVAVLKNGRPSCGSSFGYDGTFSKTSVPGEGITAALLRRRGIEYVVSLEADLASGESAV